MFCFLNAWWIYSFVIILEPYSYASCASVYHHSQYKVSKWQACVSVGIHHNCTADPGMRHRVILGIKLTSKIWFSKVLFNYGLLVNSVLKSTLMVLLYSNMLLKLQYFGHLMKRPWCWERLKAGGEGDDRGWNGWMASLTQWIWVWASSESWWWTGRPGVLQSVGHRKTQLSSWTTTATPGSEDKGCVCLKEMWRKMTPIKASSWRH